MDRTQQLGALAADLSALVSVLRRDPRCQWTKHLTDCLSAAERLLSGGWTQEQVSELAGSVMCIYGGAGSFNDYAPVTYVGESGRLEILPGMEAVDTLAGEVYQSALALRTVAEA